MSASSAKPKCRAPCQGTAPQRGVDPPGNCRSSQYVEFGDMLSWAGKPPPRNVFGGFYSTKAELRFGLWQGHTEGAAARALTTRPRPARAWRAADAVRRSVRGILVRAPALLEALVQRQAPLASKLDPAVNQARIDPAGCGEQIERCPQLRKSAPVRVHG